MMIKHHDVMTLRFMHNYTYVTLWMLWSRAFYDDVSVWCHEVNTIKRGSWSLLIIGNADLKLLTTVFNLSASGFFCQCFSPVCLSSSSLQFSLPKLWYRVLWYRVLMSSWVQELINEVYNWIDLCFCLCLRFELNPTPKSHISSSIANATKDLWSQKVTGSFSEAFYCLVLLRLIRMWASI